MEKAEVVAFLEQTKPNPAFERDAPKAARPLNLNDRHATMERGAF